MKYLYTFENYTVEIPKAVIIQKQDSLMDKTIDKELTEEEKKKLIDDDKEEEIKRKRKIGKKKEVD